MTKTLCTINIDLISEDDSVDESWNLDIEINAEDAYKVSSIAAKAVFKALQEAGFNPEGLCH